MLCFGSKNLDLSNTTLAEEDLPANLDDVGLGLDQTAESKHARGNISRKLSFISLNYTSQP